MDWKSFFYGVLTVFILFLAMSSFGLAHMGKINSLNADIDLTLVYEKLKKMDPQATWFLHVGRKMLLNGTPKNPKMVPTKLSLTDIIKVLESV